MLCMVLNDGETYSDLRGCMIVRVPDRYEGDEIESAIKEGESAGVELVFGFDGSEMARELTDEERALIEEGLNYTEEHGAPGMVPAMRPHTQRHERLRVSIDAKLATR